eukprot:NODE_5375_length_711_cov_6.794562_g1999_i3.p3 GENE.NODE_5375_length_711_cov_6.794562_g1999_i3~~NODE_5375_length_711_cov_6.794562_g1999_i3.p3  ORF type:complete len:94 (+),score=7.56 NODE_5375_length_711_cov_6.794562_g1999_i3:341-622(+)
MKGAYHHYHPKNHQQWRQQARRRWWQRLLRLRLARRQVAFLGFLHSSHRSGRRDRLLVLRLLPQSFRGVFKRLYSVCCGQCVGFLQGRSIWQL